MKERINSDLYAIQEYIEELKKKNIDNVDEETLLLSTFGYMGDLFAHQIKDNITMSSLWIDEMFPIRATMEKNLITHAMMAKIDNINAVPSYMDILIGVPMEELLNNMEDIGGDQRFIIDKKTPFYFGNFEFHLDYDIQIQRHRNVAANDNDVYSAMYLIGRRNPLSTIGNQYLQSPYIGKIGMTDYLYLICRISQVEPMSIHRPIITSDEIQNKTMLFSFEYQLADFHIRVQRGSETLHVVPLYEGTPILDTYGNYCYYNIVNNNTIKLIFDNNSYTPRLNDDIFIEVQTTQGANGNFSYVDEILIEPQSDKYEYKDITFIGKPVTDAEFGKHRMSVNDLKNVIPRELLSRGGLTLEKDIQNYFDELSDTKGRMYISKKADNQFERTYSAFMISKNERGHVIPTNTINIRMNDHDFEEKGNRLVLLPSKQLVVGNNHEKDVVPSSYIVAEEGAPNVAMTVPLFEKENFLYRTPFTTVINKDPLSISYYLTAFNRNYLLDFVGQNNSVPVQLISRILNWRRDVAGTEDSDFYVASMRLEQNIMHNVGLIETDPQGRILNNRIKPIMVFYNNSGIPFRYIEGNLEYYNDKDYTYNYSFRIRTNDNITPNSNIVCTNLKNVATGHTELASLLNGERAMVKIFILVKYDMGTIYTGNTSRDPIINEINDGEFDEYTQNNTYTINQGLSLFTNFSDVIASKVSIRRDEAANPLYYYLQSVPVIRYSYLSDSNNIIDFANYILARRLFMDRALELMENNFALDFKFFNTYGPSRIFNIGNRGDRLDKVNVSLDFNIRFTTESNTDIYLGRVREEIIEFVEDINDLKNIHISNLISHLETKFNFIKFIEFKNINGYDSSFQNIRRREISNDIREVPEFITIDRDSRGTPNVNLSVI